MHGVELPFWTVLPFAGLLLSIALLPLFAHPFWESHRNKALVAALFGAPAAAYMAFGLGAFGVHELAEKAKEYVSFMLLLGSLFVITGGIYIRGSLSGTPLVNTGVLALGAAARERDRHHRRLRAADPPAAARQRAARAEDPRDRVLHLRGLELRRAADAARRSAALPRLPEGRALRVDACGSGRSGCSSTARSS